VQSSRGMLGKIMYDDEVSANFSDALANIASSFENIDVLSRDLRRGQGTFGQLLTDEGSAYEDLASLLKTGREIVDDAKAGRGAIGMLLANEEVAADVGVFVDNLARISTSFEGTARAIDQGEGVIGMLVRDTKLREDVKAIFDKLAAGEGTLGKLVTDGQVYEDLAAAARNLRQLSDAANNGDGTVALLIHDDALYQDIRTMLAKLTGSLEEAREAAPISTFLNTVFLGF
jgi:phospholipid/cholesterol/gamma-HCH transport system substrate-binding protein